MDSGPPKTAPDLSVFRVLEEIYAIRKSSSNTSTANYKKPTNRESVYRNPLTRCKVFLPANKTVKESVA
tara:strand:+ start:232 stop:438 length:207 start_codon:yes stop_codon:yes gene_type:complete